MKILTRTLLTLTLLLGVGCASANLGYPVNMANVGEIQPYLTSRADVRGLLGPPMRTHQVGAVSIDVHKYVTPDSFDCVFVSYQGDRVMTVNQVR